MRPGLVVGMALDARLGLSWAEDVERVRDEFGLERFDVVVVNGAGFHYSRPIKYWVSIHGPHLVEWLPRRAAMGWNTDFEAYGNFGGNQESGPCIRWQKPNGSGSSGLFGVLLLMDKGYDRIVLAGVPIGGRGRVAYHGTGDCGVRMDDVVHDPQPSNQAGFACYRGGWDRRMKELRPIVRSMSGWTREQFGHPTEEWLNGN